MAGEDIRCSAEHPCTAVALLTQKIGIHDEMLNELKNRYPREVTVAAAVGSLIIGILGTVAFK